MREYEAAEYAVYSRKLLDVPRGEDNCLGFAPKEAREDRIGGLTHALYL